MLIATGQLPAILPKSSPALCAFPDSNMMHFEALDEVTLLGDISLSQTLEGAKDAIFCNLRGFWRLCRLNLKVNDDLSFLALVYGDPKPAPGELLLPP